MTRPPAHGHALRRQRTRRAILDSAAHLTDAQGFAATTVAEIARRAGVSERTFYMHFPAKEDLLFAHVQEFSELARRAAREGGSSRPRDRVRTAVLALIEAACTDEAISRNATLRAVTATRGELPRALAAQMMRLAHDLASQIAAETGRPLQVVAPIVGAAIGAVEAAGLVGALDEGATPPAQREAMTRALDAALQGFREETDVGDEEAGQVDCSRPSQRSAPSPSRKRADSSTASSPPISSVE